MLFNSAVFLFLFLPVTYGVFWALRSKQARYLWLTVMSYIFYGYWNPAFCILMVISTLDSYFAGLGFLRWGHIPKARKWLLIVPVAIDLGMLAYFKYVDFAISILNWPLGWAGRAPLEPLHILLPIGISFYTFGTITYVIDAYRGVIRPTRNLLEFSCFVSLFSQLVAGPIIRFSELKDDLENINQTSRRNYLDVGWSFFVLGLAQKMLIADTIATVIDPALRNIAGLSTLGAWLCILGYSYQLYFDFAGYSNMAIGLGYLFGLRIPLNFNAPYKALNPSDFWRRWHITLSRCLRDYLYISLGGNRNGEAQTYRNLMITMLLGGLWHGASWNFVVWGAYHGLLLSLYRRFAATWDAQPAWLQRAGMFLLVMIGWVFFRAPTLTDAMTWLNRMFIPQSGVAITGVVVLGIALLVAAVFAHFGRSTWELTHRWTPAQAVALTAVLVLCLVAMYGGKNSPYLYFQF